MKRIAVLDLETDPFEYGCVPEPFVAGFYDSERFISFWGDDCVDRLCAYLEMRNDDLVIYAHNGGRFDFFYFLKHMRHEAKIINSRIVQAKIGRHELRDSYALMPFPLAAYKKDEMDYSWLKRENRLQHKDAIIDYLRGDCVYLYELVANFCAEFGNKLTIGATALKQLKSFHSFTCGNSSFDERFRDTYYFGGRNQVFRSGILPGPWRIYDVNSMYPYVMANYLHPIGTYIDIDREIRKDTCFVVCEGLNKGAFPVRNEKGALDFTAGRGRYSTTIHEFNAALDTGTFDCSKVIKTYNFPERTSFDLFVHEFYRRREAAKIRVKQDPNDLDAKRESLFTKFILNSAYGKFAQNPANFFDWQITCGSERPEPWHECDDKCVREGDELFCKQSWSPAYMHSEYVVWQRPIQSYHFNNIATGASITGAARAELLRGLHAAVDPIYCDTDSVICRSISGVPVDDSTLGSWKLEAIGSVAAIAGKKLYAIFDETGECIKKAHKGSRLTGAQIKSICRGKTVEYANPVPAFKFDGSHTFTTRRIKKTGVI